MLTGTGLHFVARLATAACSGFAVVLNGQWLGDAAFGRFTFHMNLFLVAHTLVDFGSFAIAVRESTRRPEAEAAILRAVCFLRSVAITVCVAALVVTAFAVEATGKDALLPALAALHLFGVVPATAGVWLQTRVRLLWLALSPVVGMALYLAGSLLLRGAGVHDPGAYLLAWGVGVFVQSLVPWLAARRHVALIGPRDRRLERELLVEMAPLGLSTAVATLYFRLDANFLKHFRDDAAVGRFQHVFQLLAFSINVPSNLTAALVPTLVRASHRGADEVVRITRRVGAVLAGLALPFAAMALSWSPQLLWLLWARKHHADPLALTFDAWLPTHGDEVASARLLGLAGVAIFLTYPQMTALLALSRQRLMLLLSIGALVAKAALSCFTVAEFGVVGAAATTLAIEAGVCAASAVLLARAVGGAVFSRQLIRPLLPASVVGAAAFALRDLSPFAVAPLMLLFAGAAIGLARSFPLRLGADG